MKKPLFPEEQEPIVEESESNWLVSYADMMTLLMAFFAIMFSFSSIDSKKFDEVRKSVTKEFGGKLLMPFEALGESLREVIKKRNLEEKVHIEETSNSLSVIFQGSILFQSGSTELNSEAKDTVSEFIDILREKAFGFPILVEGHTDDTPITSSVYPSNWELSSSRACLILRMLETKGFARSTLQGQGFADTRPIAPNRDEKGVVIPNNQALNRRITIRILKGPSANQ